MSFVVQKDVFWLQVSVDYIAFVQIFETQNYLSRIETCFFRLETALLFEQLSEVTALHELHHEV